MIAAVIYCLYLCLFICYFINQTHTTVQLSFIIMLLQCLNAHNAENITGFMTGFTHKSNVPVKHQQQKLGNN